MCPSMQKNSCLSWIVWQRFVASKMCVSLDYPSGQVEKSDWSLVQVKRRVNGLSRGKKMHWITLHKWHRTILNWFEFAERNEIPVPDDVRKF